MGEEPRSDDSHASGQPTLSCLGHNGPVPRRKSHYSIRYCLFLSKLQVRTNALFASMVFAWSFTEVIRYTFYAANLLGYNPPLLLWLRYTTFYLLYPLGAGSEALLMYFTLPDGAPISRAGSIPSFTGAWSLGDYGRAILFIIWWPGALSF